MIKDLSSRVIHSADGALGLRIKPSIDLGHRRGRDVKFALPVFLFLIKGEGPCHNGLCLQSLQRPAGGHLPGNNPIEIPFEIHDIDDIHSFCFALDDPDLSPVPFSICLQLPIHRRSKDKAATVQRLTVDGYHIPGSSNLQNASLYFFQDLFSRKIFHIHG